MNDTAKFAVLGGIALTITLLARGFGMYITTLENPQGMYLVVILVGLMITIGLARLWVFYR